MRRTRLIVGALSALVLGAWVGAAKADDTMRLVIKPVKGDTPFLSLMGEEADTLAVAGPHGGHASGGYRGGYVGGGYRGGYVGGYRGGFRGGYVGGYRGGYVGGYRGGYWGGGRWYGGGRYWGGYGPRYYGRGWGGWWGGYPLLSLAFSRPYYYYDYYAAPPVYYAPSFYSTPYCPIEISAGTLPFTSTLQSGVPPIDAGPQPERLQAAPRRIPSDGTFPYDGGPARPVPMPRLEPQPTTVPPADPVPQNKVVAMPRGTEKPSKFAYPAYGEEPGKTSFAADRVAPREVPKVVKK